MHSFPSVTIFILHRNVQYEGKEKKITEIVSISKELVDYIFKYPFWYILDNYKTTVFSTAELLL